MQPVTNSGDLLMAARTGAEVQPLLDTIAGWHVDALEAALPSQEDRLAFWINLYNAFLQVRLQQDPTALKHKVKLFMGRHFTVAGKKLGLEEIEHDLLRRGTFKLSFGYVRDPFLSSYKKRLMTMKVDPRIHFALNCGAKSCPPIRFYDARQIDEQLDLATRSFLAQDVDYDPASHTATVTPLFSWFRGDFGGMKGVRQFLAAYDLIPDTGVKLKFSKYDWDARLNHYADAL